VLLIYLKELFSNIFWYGIKWINLLKLHKFVKYVFSDQSVCVICNESDERPTSKLGEKGCQGLIAASSLKGIMYINDALHF
jgi:hypothetical protein